MTKDRPEGASAAARPDRDQEYVHHDADVDVGDEVPTTGSNDEITLRDNVAAYRSAGSRRVGRGRIAITSTAASACDRSSRGTSRGSMLMAERTTKSHEWPTDSFTQVRWARNSCTVPDTPLSSTCPISWKPILASFEASATA